MSDNLFQLVQVVYWIGLSTWFGAVLFIAIAAPVVFKTVAEYRPILPNVLSVNMENQHATLLAGSVVGAIIARLSRVQLICAGVLAVTMLGQLFTINLDGDLFHGNRGAYLLRVVLYLGALAAVVYDWRILWPRVLAFRDTYVQNADDPDIANPARENFDRAQRTTASLLMVVTALLLGIIALSANISPKLSNVTPLNASSSGQ